MLDASISKRLNRQVLDLVGAVLIRPVVWL